MIRTVATGDIGLDVILGGGWQLVERLPGRESASVLIRGGPGTGKTLLSVDVALALAGALNGDVVVACVELLPSEYAAQIEAGRQGLVFNEITGRRVFQLPQSTVQRSTKRPRIFCGLLQELDPEAPDLVSGLEALAGQVSALGAKPVVFVVDSLIAGYGLGASTPRSSADAVMKFAAQQGAGLVLCAETTEGTPAVWDFAADTVLVLDQDALGSRQIQVRKHRYGASVLGWHQFKIQGYRQPEIYPKLSAWQDIDRVFRILARLGWRQGEGNTTTLSWPKFEPRPPRKYTGSLVLVEGPNPTWVRHIAFRFRPERSGLDRCFDLDAMAGNPQVFDDVNSPQPTDDEGTASHETISVPTGASAAMCRLAEEVASWMSDQPRRLLIGDLASVDGASDPEAWMQMISTIAWLLEGAGYMIPVVAYSSANSEGSYVLRSRADLLVQHLRNGPEGTSIWRVSSRLKGTVEELNWDNAALAAALPQWAEPCRSLYWASHELPKAGPPSQTKA